jgi:predicted AAA+ superfamily ATPase
MIPRKQLAEAVMKGLERAPAVALLGPRQCGKTTLARELAARHPGAARVFDLEHPADEAALRNPLLAIERLRGLVVIDEVQRLPELYPVLRVLLDRPGTPARFLLLGSASPHLVRGVTESLAGRVAFVDMQGFSLDDVGLVAERMLWLRGGFPRSFLAVDDGASFAWRNDFLRSFSERDFGTLGLGATPASLGRLWRMAAHHHGQYLNASEFGRSLGETHKTVLRHLEMLAAAFMIRLLPPWFENLGKRLVRRPKLYVRDSGLLHALLGISDESALLGHPKLGGSWEGFAMEEIIARLPHDECSFWIDAASSGKSRRPTD